MAANDTARRRITVLSALLGGALALPAMTTQVFGQHHGGGGHSAFGGGTPARHSGGMSQFSRGFAQPQHYQAIARPQQHQVIAQPQYRQVIAQPQHHQATVPQNSRVVQPSQGAVQQNTVSARHARGTIPPGTVVNATPRPGTPGGQTVLKTPANTIHHPGVHPARLPSNTLVNNSIAAHNGTGATMANPLPKPNHGLSTSHVPGGQNAGPGGLVANPGRRAGPAHGPAGAIARGVTHHPQLNLGLHKTNAGLLNSLSKASLSSKNTVVSLQKAPISFPSSGKASLSSKGTVASFPHPPAIFPWKGKPNNGPNHSHLANFFAFESLLLAQSLLSSGGYGGPWYGGYGGPWYPSTDPYYSNGCPPYPLIMTSYPPTDPTVSMDGSSLVSADSQVTLTGGEATTIGDTTGVVQTIGDTAQPGASPGATIAAPEAAEPVEAARQVAAGDEPPTPLEPDGHRLVLVNPKDSGGAVNFLLDGQLYTIDPGGVQTLDNRASWLVEFDRGESFGPTRYTLTEGTYTFTVTEKGWNLFNTKFNVTLDNSDNPYDFHFVKGNRAEVVQAGRTQALTSKYEVAVSFDQGVGGEPASRVLSTGVYRVGLNPETDRLDLLPAAPGKTVRPEPAERGTTQLAGDTSDASGK